MYYSIFSSQIVEEYRDIEEFGIYFTVFVLILLLIQYKIRAQTHLCPVMIVTTRLKHVRAQTCVGTNVCGHKHVWAQSCLGTNVCGHKRVWAQTCVGTIVWAQSCMGTNVVEPSKISSFLSRWTVSGNQSKWLSASPFTAAPENSGFFLDICTQPLFLTL